MVSMKKISIKSAVKQLILVIASIIWIIPVIQLLLTSFKTPEDIMKTSPLELPKGIQFGNYIGAWNYAHMGILFINSIKLLALSLLITVILSALSSYPIARMKFKGKKIVFLFILAGMMVPIQATVITLFYMVKKMGLINNHLGLALVYSAFAMPMSVFIYSNYMKTIPFEIEESAIVDGCSKYGFFFRILIPLIKPSTATVVINITINVWNDLLIQMLLLTSGSKKTLTSGLAMFRGMYSTQWDLTLASVVIISVPVIIFYIILQKYIISGLSMGAVKG